MSGPTKKPFVILTYAVLVLSTLLVYWQVRSFGFVNYDDNLYVYDNPHVTGGLTYDSVVWAFTTGYAVNWHPLTWLSLMLDCQLSAANPGWMHLVNLFFHLANTLLLFAVLRMMTGSLWPSAFVAAAFALHPMHVESVAWITERKDVLSTFFLLLTLAAYVGYVKRPSIPRYLMALALFALGLMAKPMLVTLPLLLLLLDYWPLNRFDARSRKLDGRASLSGIIIEKIPFFVLAAASSAITFLVQRAGGSVKDIVLEHRVVNVFASYVKYLGKMFWPENLAVFYPLNADGIALWQVAMCILLLLVISVLVVWFGRRHAYLPVGWLWFVGTLVPVIGIVQVGAQSMADRYTYIPYIGLFIMIAWGLPQVLAKWPQGKVVLGMAAAVVLTAMAIGSYRQVGYWKNTFTLFTHASRVTQKNHLAHFNIGVEFGRLGRWQDAIGDFKAAIEFKPNYAEAHFNLGVAYAALGRWQEAIEAYENAIKVKPDYAEAHHGLGSACKALGRRTEAIEDYKQAIKFKPDYAEAYYDLGVVYGDLGRWQEATGAYKQATTNRANYAEAYNNCGGAYSALGRWQEATESFKAAIRSKPNYAEAHYNLGVAYGNLGLLQEEMAGFREAIRIDPGFVQAVNGLAWLIAVSPQLKDRDVNEGIRLARGACELVKYKNPAFLATLAAAYASAGRFAEAVDTAGKALSLAETTNQPQLKDIIRYQLSLYKQGKPYIAPVTKPLPDSSKP